MISMTYIQCNALLSCIFANREWYNYASERKSLRVSAPVGLQRSSYYISMPWKFAIPFIITFAFLHYILSQSIFVISLESVLANGEIDRSLYSTTIVGFSTWPIITGKHQTILQLPAVSYNLRSCTRQESRIKIKCGL